jgi:hypothetical protein
VLALLAPLAAAQEQVCSDAVSLEALRFDLDEAEVALGQGDGDNATEALSAAMDRFACVSAPVYPEDVAHAARLSSLLAFFQQDDEEVARWGQLWRAVAPQIGALTRVSPQPERWLAMVDAAGPATTGGPGGGLAAPKKGVILVDGRAMSEPVVEVGLPHFVQVLDRKGSVQAAFWQDGVVFPAEWLAPEATAIPAWWVESVAARAPFPLPTPEPAPAPAPAAVPKPAAKPVPAPAPAHPEAPVFDAPPPACSWGEGDPASATATNRAVVIEGQTWPLKTEEQRAAFRAAIRECHEFRASRRFDRWQEAKKKLFSRDARTHRETMVRFLLEPEPPKPGKRNAQPKPKP